MEDSFNMVHIIYEIQYIENFAIYRLTTYPLDLLIYYRHHQRLMSQINDIGW